MPYQRPIGATRSAFFQPFKRPTPLNGAGIEANLKESGYGSRSEPLYLPSFPRKRESRIAI